MHSISAALASILISYTNAAPSTGPARTPDRCGPLIQNPGDPTDTCTSKPLTVTRPAAFGVLGFVPDLPGFSPADGDAQIPFPYDWSSCNPTVTQVCAAMTAPDVQKNTWHFINGPSDTPKQGDLPCQMGFWLPSDPNAAAIPQENQCEIIFNTAVSACAAENPNWGGATINLATNPAGQPNQLLLPNGKGTGSAINAGYPSYVVISGVGGGPTQEKPYGCTDPEGRPCTCSADLTGCAMEMTCIDSSTGATCPCNPHGTGC